MDGREGGRDGRFVRGTVGEEVLTVSRIGMFCTV